MARRAILSGVMLALLLACGCRQGHQEWANCGWTMRARAQAQLQDHPETDAEIYTDYEKTFILNEMTYYRTQPDMDQPGGTVYAAQKNLESDQSERMQ